MNKDAEPFDLEAVHDAEIYPLMVQITAICKRVNMPMLATFCFKKGGRNADDPEGVDYCTTTLPRGEWQPPEIRDALQIILNGSHTRPKLMAFTVTQACTRE